MTDPAHRLAAALADRYRIERELGQGGMATVYLAHDVRHDRRVALKVLRPELAAVLGAERFVQEIRTTAALQHPHILPLFDSGTADGFLYYVMPYIQGETLRDKLNRETQLGIDEAVGIAADIAGALDYAHRSGVIHRDIKPENILLHDGRPMVADFGIALALSAAAGGRMTETGLSLGTPHYMSPEQATAAKDISARSDVYSLASVLYEMLAGNPPHVGSSAQQIIMKIVTTEAAPVTDVRKSVPPHVAAAIAKALEKLPADRFDSARAFAEALRDPQFTAAGRSRVTRAPAAFTAPAASRRRIYALLALNTVLLAAALIGWLRPVPVAPPSRQRVALWQQSFGYSLAPGVQRHATQAALAPDGSSLVFSDSAGDGLRLVRKLRHEGEPTPMAGTEGGVSPFFSPDGRWIGYLTVDGALRKVPAGGGGSITLAENGNLTYVTAAWLDDGTIVFVDDSQRVRRIPAQGGAGRALGTDESTGRRNIATLSPLPGSRGFLYTSCPGNCAIESAVYGFDFAADTGRLLVANAAGAWYAPTGHLLYTDRAGGLYAAGFDPDRLELTSGAVPIIEDVVPVSFALSASGSALYSVGAAGARSSELMWVSRDGRAEPLDSSWRGDFEYPALSPDGRAVAVSVRDGSTQLWIRRSDGTRQKLTQDGTVNWRPSWTRDGRSVLYVSNARGGGGRDDFDVYRMAVDGSATPELVQRHIFGLWEAEVSPDERWLVVRSDEAGGQGIIRGRRLGGDTALVPLVSGRGRGTSLQLALSPDGRWLAYVSTATGRPEVYVTPFPDASSPRLVSRDGGTEPRWAHSGRELFYRSGGQLMAVAVAPGPTFNPGVPQPLFSVAGYRTARNRQQYDVAPDDRRFVMIRDRAENARGQVVYVENWFEELKTRIKQ